MTYFTNVSRVAVSDRNDLLAVVATRPEQWVAHVGQPGFLEAVGSWTWNGRESGGRGDRSTVRRPIEGPRMPTTWSMTAKGPCRRCSGTGFSPMDGSDRLVMRNGLYNVRSH